ncbi:hypothetical protein G6F59_018056 [Rhizopus arrhizus]|nr:hypothetical protein G6F59_018056 [Rhizopus arrhizus]
MGRKETKEAIADSRAGRVPRIGSVSELTADEVHAEAAAAGEYPLPPEQREWIHAPAVGRELLLEDLQSAEAIHAYLAQAKDTGDTAHIDHAHKIAAQAKIRYGIK